MASIAAGLQNSPALDVVQVLPDSPDFPKKLAELAPAVIAYDPKQMPERLTVSLLKKRPELLLVSVDRETHVMSASSGHHAKVHSTRDFLKLIALSRNGTASRKNGESS